MGAKKETFLFTVTKLFSVVENFSCINTVRVPSFFIDLLENPFLTHTYTQKMISTKLYV